MTPRRPFTNKLLIPAFHVVDGGLVRAEAKDVNADAVLVCQVCRKTVAGDEISFQPGTRGG